MFIIQSYRVDEFDYHIWLYSIKEKVSLITNKLTYIESPHAVKGIFNLWTYICCPLIMVTFYHQIKILIGFFNVNGNQTLNLLLDNTDQIRTHICCNR